MLHDVNLFSSPSSAFHFPPNTHVFNFWQGGQLESPPSIVGARTYPKKKKKLTTITKKIGRPTKEGAEKIKKTDKKDVTKVGESDEDKKTCRKNHVEFS